MTEELTAEERATLDRECSGLLAKLLRLYDAALARAENWERQWDMLKVQHDEALARAEELQHCCDRACQSRSQLNRLDTSVEKALAFLDKTRAEIEAGKPEPSSALCLLWLSTCAVEQRNVLDERQTVSCCQAAMSAESALTEAMALLVRIEKYAREDRASTGKFTRLARALDETREWLKLRTPAPAAKAEPVLCHPTDPCAHGITGPCSRCQS